LLNCLKLTHFKSLVLQISNEIGKSLLYEIHICRLIFRDKIEEILVHTTESEEARNFMGKPIAISMTNECPLPGVIIRCSSQVSHVGVLEDGGFNDYIKN